jgi:integrase
MASIKKRGSVYRARYRDDTGREHARHFDTRTEAQSWLDKVTTARVTGTYIDPRAGKVTFTAFYREWSQRQVWEQTTVSTMDSTARSVTFLDIQLNKIRKSHLEAWVKGMAARGLAARTIRSRFGHMATVFAAAVGDRLISDDPTKGVRLPALRRTEAAMKIPTPAEVAALLEAADDDFACFIALAAFSGMREGEAAAIQVGDIDWLHRTITISRQVQRVPGPNNVEVRLPKYGSERVVFAPDALLAMLGELVRRRDIVGASDEFLFTGIGDNPPHANVIWHRWRAVCKRAGVEGVTVHTLRHYYASGLIRAGCDVVTVQRAMGHASAAVTLRTYAHLWPDAEDRTRGAAAGMMADAARIADSVRTDLPDFPSTQEIPRP